LRPDRPYVARSVRQNGWVTPWDARRVGG
jgi:hypothetical protein